MNVAAMGQIFATTQAMNRGEAVEAPVSAPAATSPLPRRSSRHREQLRDGATLSGGKLVSMRGTMKSAKLIEREKVNTLSAVPMMTRELLAHPDFADYDTLA